MSRGRWPLFIPGLLLVISAFGISIVGQRLAAAPQSLQISDEQFWKWIVSTAEPEPAGAFSVDNFVSNEMGLYAFLPVLEKAIPQGGVFIGVGPEQNFTYAVSLHPKVVFVIDIRRQNMIEHLIYKAIFEMSGNRADFLARLFSRKRPSGLGDGASIAELIAAFRAVPQDEILLKKNLGDIKDLLMKKHGFALTEADQKAIDHVCTAFAYYGTQITYNTGYPPPARPVGGMPDYEKIMSAADPLGRNFMASEENYRFIRSMEEKNLIIPLVGDFGGTTTVRAAGQIAKDLGTKVSGFYTSNVEQYLFGADARIAPGRPGTPGSGGAMKFYDNVAVLPVDADSIFIRSNGINQGAPAGTGGFYSPILSSPILETLSAVKAGSIKSYADLLAFSK